jgi:hypothetical protein
MLGRIECTERKTELRFDALQRLEIATKKEISYL